MPGFFSRANLSKLRTVRIQYCLPTKNKIKERIFRADGILRMTYRRVCLHIDDGRFSLDEKMVVEIFGNNNYMYSKTSFVIPTMDGKSKEDQRLKTSIEKERRERKDGDRVRMYKRTPKHLPGVVPNDRCGINCSAKEKSLG
jgi:hypothetical protein